MRQRPRRNASRKNGLDSGVESRGPELLERLAPPCRHQPPAHGREHALATAHYDRVDLRRGTHVVARLEVRGGRGEAVEIPQLAPGIFACETAAHDAVYIAAEWVNCRCGV